MDKIMQTIDKRPRISDGSHVCSSCGNIIPQGEVFETITEDGFGQIIQHDICDNCRNRTDINDVAACAVVVGFVIFCITLLGVVLS